MANALLVLAQALTASGARPDAYPLRFAWDWDTRPPCLTIADLTPRPAVDQTHTIVDTRVQVNVWDTDGFAALAVAEGLCDAAVSLAPFACDDGKLLHCTVFQTPTTGVVSPLGDGEGDTSLVRMTTIWGVTVSA